jgi:hypothetical protein
MSSAHTGLPRYVWTDERPDPTTYTLMLLRAVAERQRWRTQYDQAKTRTAVETVDSLSESAPPSGGGPPSPSVAHSSASPDNPPNPGLQDRQSSVSAANPQDRSEATALDGRGEAPLLQLWEAEPVDPEPSRCRPPEDRR